MIIEYVIVHTYCVKYMYINDSLCTKTLVNEIEREKSNKRVDQGTCDTGN